MFDLELFYLNSTTPHLATRTHEVCPERIQVPKRGQSNSSPKAQKKQLKSQSADKTNLTNIRQHGSLAPDFPGFPSASRWQCGPQAEEMAGQIQEFNCRNGDQRRNTKTCSSATLQWSQSRQDFQHA